MKLCNVAGILFSASAFIVAKCQVAKVGDGSKLAAQHAKLKCQYVEKPEPPKDTILKVKGSGFHNEDYLNTLKKASRVCLPKPCENITAYSGYIPVDEKKESSFLFFLHIKSEDDMKKPLLLWLQGGPGKSSLFGQFLENGPLGIDTSGQLFYRQHTLQRDFNIIYLDQPVGSGYSFDIKGKYLSSLEDASTHVITFFEQFLEIFREYKGRDFYIAGESYGARFTVGVAHKLKNKLPLKLKGVMLGVGFLFPLLDIINSTDFLYYARLLDNCSRDLFAERFDNIKHLAAHKKYLLNATVLLSQTVLNLRKPGQTSLFEKLTGFKHHGSIISPQVPKEALFYYRYANSSGFKKIIHVDATRTLDGTRYNVAMQLALHDFFVDHREALLYVLNNARVLFYTAQLDDVFPALNIDQSFKKLQWRGYEAFKVSQRMHWHRQNNASLELLGYLKRAGALMYANVLFGGHYISLDRSSAVSELYSHFLKVMKGPPAQPSPGETNSC
ncbi:venom serine carboxypeptidase [Rhipicephalus sanguineus]|uniref:venom serine carboxypeptidase n=1 Tax=Rhipicephalus sanguineus TaxID=34632 RepID=UPI00189482BE|nr:venom serine carboxypeptidase [Rhipicephalus sanguineus]